MIVPNVEQNLGRRTWLLLLSKKTTTAVVLLLGSELIRLHRDLGITTIYVTHDQVEAMTMGSRIAVMNNGVVQQCASPLFIYHHPANLFVAGFIGSPAMNFLPAKLVVHQNAIVADLGDFVLPLPESYDTQVHDMVGKTVTLGIRPEDIFDGALPASAPSAPATAKVQVDVTEPVGSNVFAYLKTQAHEFVASFNSDTSARPGQQLDVTFNMARCHLFDIETEESLLRA